MNLRDIVWGDDSAERDPNLLEYFVASEHFRRVAEKSKGIVIGRKGSGKSALRTKLAEVFTDQDRTFVINLSPSYNSIKTVLNDRDIVDDFGEEVFFQHTWLRQMYLDALCEIGNSVGGSFTSASWEFARDVSRQLNRTSKDLVENIADVLKSIKIKAGNLGDLGLALERELRNVADIDAMQHHLLALCDEGIRVVIMIDDLDLGWDNSATANKLLLGLLSATNGMSGLHSNIHTIIFLREDVYSILVGQTQHSDKYRNVERLRWGKEELREILIHRISYNRREFGDLDTNDPFATVFPDTVGTTHTDNWLVERTLSRPRELIQLARYYTESVESDKPDDGKLKESEGNYSAWKLDDLCSEYSNQFPGLEKIMSFWKTEFFRNKYHLKRSEIDDMLLAVLAHVQIDEPWYQEIVDNTDLGRFVQVLYEIGFVGDFVLGGAGGSKTFYSFGERHEPRFGEVQIHPCFRRAVNTVERIRS